MKLFLQNKKERWIYYAKSRFLKIYLPYVLTVSVYYLYFVWRGYFHFSLANLAGYILRGDLSAQFYFVVVIMQFYLLKRLWEFVINRIPVFWIVAVSAIVTVCGVLYFGKIFGIYNDRIFTTYLIYWILGCYTGKNYDIIINTIRKISLPIFISFFIVAVVELSFGYLKVLPYAVSEVVHILYCICAITASMALATHISDYAMEFKILKKVNVSGYYIYLWHVILIFVAEQIMDSYNIYEIGKRFFVRGVFVYVLSIILCGGYSDLKRKIKG